MFEECFAIVLALLGESSVCLLLRVCSCQVPLNVSLVFLGGYKQVVRTPLSIFILCGETILCLFLNERLVCSHKNLTKSAQEGLSSLTGRVSVRSGLQWRLLSNKPSAGCVLLSGQILSTAHELDDAVRTLTSLL